MAHGYNGNLKSGCKMHGKFAIWQVECQFFIIFAQEGDASDGCQHRKARPFGSGFGLVQF